MDAALLLAALAARAGDRVDLLAYDRAVRARVDGVAASGLLPALVHAMAPLEPALVEPDYAGMVRTILARSSRRSLVVLLTALDTAPVEAGPAAGPGAAGAPPPGGARLGRRPAVARDGRRPGRRRGGLRRGRRRAGPGRAAPARRAARPARRRGRRRGPATLAPDLADRYLALKAAGRL